MKLKRPIVRYHGGKWILAPWIISHFPPHRIYTEVFGGGGNVLLRKKPSYSEVYNDTYGLIVNVFRVLRNPEKARILKEQLILTPFSRDEFKDCSHIHEYDSDIEKARKIITRSFLGFGSGSCMINHSTGFRSNSNRSGTTPSKDWASYPKHIETFTKRLKNVTIENKDAIEVLINHDTDKTLHYIDPPYLEENRQSFGVYNNELSIDDHVKLLNTSKELSGMVIISGYNNDMYNDILYGWKVVKKETTASGKLGGVKRKEVLWINPLCRKYNYQYEIKFNQ